MQLQDLSKVDLCLVMVSYTFLPFFLSLKDLSAFSVSSIESRGFKRYDPMEAGKRKKRRQKMHFWPYFFVVGNTIKGWMIKAKKFLRMKRTYRMIDKKKLFANKISQCDSSLMKRFMKRQLPLDDAAEPSRVRNCEWQVVSLMYSGKISAARLLTHFGFDDVSLN